MKAQILKLLHLKQLYGRALCGESYINAPALTAATTAPSAISNDLEGMIKNCSLCPRIKHTKSPSIGLFNPLAPLCFISETPLYDAQGFVQTKSALMLQNIIKNVFALPLDSVSILSLLKCDPHNPHFEKSQILCCMGYTLEQLKRLSPKICVLLGDNVAEHILGSHLEHSRILWHNNKNFLITHSLNDLVRNPSLKRHALNDFHIAKGAL